jgi:WD40 repeat protein
MSLDYDAVMLWDLRTDAGPRMLPGRPGDINTLATSPDGSHLVATGEDGGVQLWSIIDEATEPIVLRGHRGAVRGVAFSLDGTSLFTSGSDGTVRIWRTDASSPPLVLDGFRASSQAIAALTNDRYVTGHEDGTIRIWRCPACGPITDVLADVNQHLTRELTPEERRTYLPNSP